MSRIRLSASESLGRLAARPKFLMILLLVNPLLPFTSRLIENRHNSGAFLVLQIVQQYRQGMISAEAALDIIEKHLKSRPQIEQLAIEKGYLSMKQLRRLLQIQETCMTPFERLAIREGYLTEQQIGTLLFEQVNRARPIAFAAANNAVPIALTAQASP